MIALKSFGELVMRHKGARICVMGGGPNLPDDIAKVQADLWVSVNAHGAKLRQVDYVVAMDNNHTTLGEPMHKLIRPHTDAPIIGLWHWCDYGITNYPLAPRLMFSGVVAQWAASLMGAHPVIMAGFDCYGGGKRALNQHAEYKPFVEAAVRVVSGPLISLWPKYDAEETLPPYSPPVHFTPEVEHGVYVRVVKPVEIRGRSYPIGTILHVPLAEVWRQIKHRSLVEVEPPTPVHLLAPLAPPRRSKRIIQGVSTHVHC